MASKISSDLLGVDDLYCQVEKFQKSPRSILMDILANGFPTFLFKSKTSRNLKDEVCWEVKKSPAGHCSFSKQSIQRPCYMLREREIASSKLSGFLPLKNPAAWRDYNFRVLSSECSTSSISLQDDEVNKWPAGHCCCRKNLRLPSLSPSGENFLSAEMVLQDITGMKVLILDSQTTHLKAACFLRPTSENIQFLCRQLANPRFGEYHLIFSNMLKYTQIHILADSDEQKVVQQVQSSGWLSRGTASECSSIPLDDDEVNKWPACHCCCPKESSQSPYSLFVKNPRSIYMGGTLAGDPPQDMDGEGEQHGNVLGLAYEDAGDEEGEANDYEDDDNHSVVSDGEDEVCEHDLCDGLNGDETLIEVRFLNLTGAVICRFPRVRCCFRELCTTLLDAIQRQQVTWSNSGFHFDFYARQGQKLSPVKAHFSSYYMERFLKNVCTIVVIPPP